MSKDKISKPPDIMGDDRVLLAWQRSHMANERTFLAWSRTSISLLAFGFVIERFDIFLKHILQLQGEPINHVTSSCTILLSMFSFLLAGLAMVISGFRFLRVRRHINNGEAVYSVLPDFLVILSVVVIILMAVLLSLPRLFDIGSNITCGFSR